MVKQRRKSQGLDAALEAFDRHAEQIGELTESHFSEADTRVKFIDPLLTAVLGWDEHTQIKREEGFSGDEKRHCIDYKLSLDAPILVVEAKKNLKKFEVPDREKAVRYKLSGVIQTWPNAWDAIKQVRAYCDGIGAKYALVTNGRQYIAFRAITESYPWTEGYALVFGSLKAVRSSFTEFYECLSRQTCAKGALSSVSKGIEEEVFRDKPRSVVTSAAHGFRNTLHEVLYTAFKEVFLDNSDPDDEFLRECYCTANDVLAFGRQLDSLLVDPLPSFRTPIKAARPGDKKDPFSRHVQGAGRSTSEPLVVVMGGAGVGKTTFLQWYFRTSLDRKSKKRTVVVTCDFRSIECEPEELHARTMRELVRGLLAKAADLVQGFEQLKVIFESEIKAAIKGTLAPYAGDDVELQKRIASLIERLQTEDESHLKALVRYLRERCDRQVTLILDNIDQKSDVFQGRMYHTSQAVARSSGALVILSLRESTYQRLMRRSEFSAFTSIDFHVKAQPLSAILDKRLSYLARRLPAKTVTFNAPSGKELTVQDMEKFLRLLTRSLLPDGELSESTECLVAISNGNARKQLKLIYDFLVSGQTKVDEYFWSYAKSSTREVPFHEFLHSVVLGDRRVFDESSGSSFMNLFEPSSSPVASHFTALRILDYFHRGLGQTGQLRASDFVSLEALYQQFDAQGLECQDIDFHVERMASFGLLMPEGAEEEGALLSQPFALTKSGLYYLERLFSEATYFSLMSHDTSIFDKDVCASLGDSLARRSQDPKLPLSVRNEMSRKFLAYLESKEARELSDGAPGRHDLFKGRSYVGPMWLSQDRLTNAVN